MASDSVSRYHAHFRTQDREEGNETTCFLFVAFRKYCVIGIKGG